MLRTSQRLRVQSALTVAALLLLGGSAMAQSGLIAWGRNLSQECNIPALPPGLQYVDMVTGGYHTIATRSDGSVIAWGDSGSQQINVPALPPGLTYVQFAAGLFHSAALRSDGSVVAWGNNGYGQTNVPAPPLGTVYVQVAVGESFSVALLSNGTLLAWGASGHGELNIPVLPPGLSYVRVYAAGLFGLAKRSDSSFVYWGAPSYGASVPALPPGLTYVEISVGAGHSAGLRSDGAVVAWGDNSYGECTVPGLPTGLKYVEVEVGSTHTLARRSDGALLAWGQNQYGQTTLPNPPGPYSRYAKISCGAHFSLALLELNDPETYCTAKTNSLGCTPSISYSGLPSFSGPDNFNVTASNVMNNKAGLLLWSLTPGAIPFLGGTLCVSAPIARTLGQYSSGTPAPAQDCSGAYAYHLSQAYMVTQLLPPSTHMFAQYWSRDPGSGPPHTANNIGLTNALSFVIYP